MNTAACKCAKFEKVNRCLYDHITLSDHISTSLQYSKTSIAKLLPYLIKYCSHPRFIFHEFLGYNLQCE